MKHVHLIHETLKNKKNHLPSQDNFKIQQVQREETISTENARKVANSAQEVFVKDQDVKRAVQDQKTTADSIKLESQKIEYEKYVAAEHSKLKAEMELLQDQKNRRDEEERRVQDLKKTQEEEKSRIENAKRVLEEEQELFRQEKERESLLIKDQQQKLLEEAERLESMRIYFDERHSSFQDDDFVIIPIGESLD